MEESKSYSIEKLTESNYRSWSQVIESHLDDQGLWGVVTGTKMKPSLSPTPPTTSTSGAESSESATAEQATPTVDNIAMEEWLKKAKKARKIIISAITPSVMIYVA